MQDDIEKYWEKYCDFIKEEYGVDCSMTALSAKSDEQIFEAGYRAHAARSGWCFDMDKAPTDDPHFRGCWVHKSGNAVWEEYFGYVDNDGDFIISGIDEPAGWQPEDFEAFIAFNPPPPPQLKGGE